MRMVWLKKYFLNWPAPVYVLLGSSFPVLYLYAHNIAETKFGEAALPLGLCLAGGVVLWALLTLILRNARKAGIGTVIFLFLFFTYGQFYDGLDYLGLPVPGHGLLLPITLFIWGYCVYFISRARRDFRTTTTVLNVVAVALVAINLFSIASYQIELARTSADTAGESPSHAPAAASAAELSAPPDIYFIIMDEYAHPAANEEWCGYDNSGFINSLEEKGFFVASQSKTRSKATPQCLAQVLNMEYLTGGWYWDADDSRYVEIESQELGDVDPPWCDATFRKLGYNKVADFLKAQGYQYIAFGNWLSSTRWDCYAEDIADLYYNYYAEATTRWVSEFQETLWNTTMLCPFYARLTGAQLETAWRRQTLYTMEHLKEMPEMEGAKFVFAHIFCPHEAFVFRSRGEVVDTRNWYNYRDKEYYLGQYIFMSTEIEKVIDALLDKSETSPIIILQSDHGLRPHHTGITIDGNLWHSILNAMYLPGMDNNQLWKSISPVNTFRLIFNHYFGANYTLLEDD